MNRTTLIATIVILLLGGVALLVFAQNANLIPGISQTSPSPSPVAAASPVASPATSPLPSPGASPSISPTASPSIRPSANPSSSPGMMENDNSGQGSENSGSEDE